MLHSYTINDLIAVTFNFCCFKIKIVKEKDFLTVLISDDTRLFLSLIAPNYFFEIIKSTYSHIQKKVSVY